MELKKLIEELKDELLFHEGSLREIKGDTLLLCMPSPGEEQRLAERAVHLFEGGAPSASMGRLTAEAAPAHPGAPPEHLGSWPWAQ